MRGFAWPLVLSLFGVACNVYDPGLVAECTGHQPPTRPSAAGGQEERTVTFALRDLIIEQTNRWREIGFNIDGYCTSETRPRGDCTPRGPIPQDGNDGIDNQLGRSVFALVNAVQPTLASTTTVGLIEGRSNPALRISGWNGTQNDSLIAVEIFNFTAVVDGSAGQPDITLRNGLAYLPDNTRAPLPMWNGMDYGFAPDSTELFVNTAGDPNQVRGAIRDDSAYIANGTLVARVPQGVQLTFPGMAFSLVIRLLDGIIAGQIDPETMTLSQIQIAGRWSLPDLLRTAANVGVCPQTANYQTLEQTLLNNADVFADNRNRGMSLPCDAVSVGLLFETGRVVRVANVFVTQPSTAMPCMTTDAGIDAAVDASSEDAPAASDASRVDVPSTDASRDGRLPSTDSTTAPVPDSAMSPF